jgi:solute carrier family 25 carnitine/acylcarnitine transporter 20/29
MRALNANQQRVTLTSALLAGGIAGVFCWVVVYPVDYIKTLMQTDDLLQPRQRSMLGYCREELSRGSFKRFFLGFEIMIVRAFFVNAAGFFCFEMGKRLVYRTPQ